MTAAKTTGRRSSDMKGNTLLGMVASVLFIATSCGAIILWAANGQIDKKTRPMADEQLIQRVKVDQNCEQIKRFENKLDEVNKNINARFDKSDLRFQDLQKFLMRDHK